MCDLAVGGEFITNAIRIDIGQLLCGICGKDNIARLHKFPHIGSFGVLSLSINKAAWNLRLACQLLSFAKGCPGWQVIQVGINNLKRLRGAGSFIVAQVEESDGSASAPSSLDRGFNDCAIL